MKHNDPLTLAAARAHFREFWLPMIRPSDRPAVRLAWSQFIDALHRERKISDKQAHSWDIPENFGRPRKALRKNPPARHEFLVQPYGDYYTVQHRWPNRPGMNIVFRSDDESIADQAATALRSVAKQGIGQTTPPDDLFAVKPHDARRGGWRVVDTRTGAVLAEDMPKGEAETLAGALWNLVYDIGRLRDATRKNPSCGCRSNPSKGRKPKRATKRAATRATAKPRRATTTRKHR